MELDEVLHQLKDWGRYQTLAFILITIAGTWFPSWQIFSGIFYMSEPDYYHCDAAPGTFPNQSLVLQNETDEGAAAFGVDSYDRCLMYDVTADSPITNETDEVECRHGWTYYPEYPEEFTTVMEMDLVCSKGIWGTTAQSIYFAGVLVGAFSAGQLSDLFGRKTIMICSLIGEGVFGLILAFMKNYTAFVTIWFFVGVFENGINIVEYVLVMEMFTPKKRTLAGCINNISWGLGVTLLAPIAWLLKDWRYMQIAISVPCFLGIFFYWIIFESLRWLLARGRDNEAKVIIEKIASFNDVSPAPLLTTSAVVVNDVAHNDYKKPIDVVTQNGGSSDKQQIAEITMKENPVKPPRLTILSLFKKPRLLLNSVNMFYQWLMCSLVYYGLSINSSELAGNKYLNFFLIGLVEIPAYALITFTLPRWGRRSTLLVANIVAAVASIITAFTPKETADGVNLQPMIVTFAMIGKLGITCSFGTVFVYGTEIFPTSIRNVGFGLCSFWSRIGGIVAPFVVYASNVYKPAPLLIFGISSLIGGSIAIFLPETLDRPLPETLEEGNNLHRTKPIRSSSRAYHPSGGAQTNAAV